MIIQHLIPATINYLRITVQVYRASGPKCPGRQVRYPSYLPGNPEFCTENAGNRWSLHSVQFSSVTQLCLALCNPMDCSTPGLPVHHQLLEFTQTQIHWVGDAIQPAHPLSSPSAFDLSLHWIVSNLISHDQPWSTVLRNSSCRLPPCTSRVSTDQEVHPESLHPSKNWGLI